MRGKKNDCIKTNYEQRGVNNKEYEGKSLVNTYTALSKMGTPFESL